MPLGIGQTGEIHSIIGSADHRLRNRGTLERDKYFKEAAIDYYKRIMGHGKFVRGKASQHDAGIAEDGPVFVFVFTAASLSVDHVHSSVETHPAEGQHRPGDQQVDAFVLHVIRREPGLTGFGKVVGDGAGGFSGDVVGSAHENFAEAGLVGEVAWFTGHGYEVEEFVIVDQFICVTAVEIYRADHIGPAVAGVVEDGDTFIHKADDLISGSAEGGIDGIDLGIIPVHQFFGDIGDVLEVVVLVIGGAAFVGVAEAVVVPLTFRVGEFFVGDGAFNLSFNLADGFRRETSDEDFGVAVVSFDQGIERVGSAGIGGDLLVVSYQQDVNQIAVLIIILDEIFDRNSIIPDYGDGNDFSGKTFLVFPIEEGLHLVQEPVVGNYQHTAGFQKGGIIEAGKIDKMAFINFGVLRVDFIGKCSPGNFVHSAGAGGGDFDGQIGVYPEGPFDRVVAEGVDFDHCTAEIAHDVWITDADQFCGEIFVFIIYFRKVEGDGSGIDGAGEIAFGGGDIDVFDFDVFGGNYFVSNRSGIRDEDRTANAGQAGKSGLLDHTLFTHQFELGVFFTGDVDGAGFTAINTIMENG